MPRHALASAALLSLLAGCAATAPPPARSLDAAALDTFAGWWPGEYDNARQSGSDNVPIRLHVARVDLPAFGERVFYAEWRGLGDDRLLRQRLYALEPDVERRAWRLKLHVFPADDAAFVARTAGAWREPARLAGVTPADMVPLPGCDILFPWDAGVRVDATATLAGEMDRRSCRIPNPGVDRPVYSWTQMRRSADRFEYLDGWFFADDDGVYRRFSKEWYVFERRR